MRPTAATVFCAEMAPIRSLGDRPSWVRRFTSNHTRMEYCCFENSVTWPTPWVRLMASSTLMVRYEVMNSGSCCPFSL